MQNLPEPSPAVQFVRPLDGAAKAKGKSLSLAQGQSAVLVKNGVSVKVCNTKFHSLLRTTYVLVGFYSAPERQEGIHQVEPAFVGQSIESAGITFAQVASVQSATKVLKLTLAPGVEVRQDFK